MNRFLPISIFVAVLLGAMASCNSDYEYTTVWDSTPCSLEVSAFSLKANDSIIENLDSLYFAVDLNSAYIYNPDSLPMGTKLGKVVVSVTFPNSVSEAKFIIPSAEEVPDTVDYLNNTTDSIDFSYNGMVYLRVVSYDAQYEMDYTVRINVHKVPADSLYWNELAYRSLPTTLSSVTAQRSAIIDDKVVCLTTDAQGNASIATTTNPYISSLWEATDVTLPAGADVNTLRANSTALYLSDGATLWESTDLGQTWTDTQTPMIRVIGAYDETILGIDKVGDTYYHVTYPATVPTAVPDGCPVDGLSSPVVYTSKWSTKPMLMIMGGTAIDADGNETLVGSTWGYDGSSWACITTNGIPAATGMVFFDYYSFTTSTQWVTTEYPSLFAFGGLTEDGTPSKVYISRDRGLHWTVGDEYLQLPEGLNTGYLTQAITWDRHMTGRSAELDGMEGWTPFPGVKLAPWVHIVPAGYDAESRITKPITSWECPYIYLMGGNSSEGVFYDTLWRGVINRLMFRPLY